MAQMYVVTRMCNEPYTYQARVNHKQWYYGAMSWTGDITEALEMEEDRAGAVALELSCMEDNADWNIRVELSVGG